MKKHALLILVLLVMALGLASPTAADGPPWKPEILIKQDGLCVMTWMTSGGEFYPVFGILTEVFQPKNGIRNGTCQLYLDFDDPDVASIDQVCSLGGNPPECRANGSIVLRGFDCYGPTGEITNLSQTVLTPSGSWMTTCHFRAD